MSDINFEEDAAPLALPADRLQRLGALCAALLQQQFAAADLDAQLQRKEDDIRKLSEEDIPELLRECGLTEVRLADGTKVTIGDEIDCGITDERKPSALAWLREHNLGGIIKTFVGAAFGRGSEQDARKLLGKLREEGYQAAMTEDVHYQTLKATIKAERAAGREVPAETFSLRPYVKTVLSLPEGAPKPPRIRKRK